MYRNMLHVHCWCSHEIPFFHSLWPTWSMIFFPSLENFAQPVRPGHLLTVFPSYCTLGNPYTRNASCRSEKHQHPSFKTLWGDSYLLAPSNNLFHSDSSCWGPQISTAPNNFVLTISLMIAYDPQFFQGINKVIINEVLEG